MRCISAEASSGLPANPSVFFVLYQKLPELPREQLVRFNHQIQESLNSFVIYPIVIEYVVVCLV